MCHKSETGHSLICIGFDDEKIRVNGDGMKKENSARSTKSNLIPLGFGKYVCSNWRNIALSGCLMTFAFFLFF